jgi:hypothetical protein
MRWHYSHGVVSQGTLFVFPVLYVTFYDPWSSYSIINVLAPFDGYVKITSREFFLLRFRFALRFSTRSRCYYASFFSHPLYSPGCTSYCAILRPFLVFFYTTFLITSFGPFWIRSSYETMNHLRPFVELCGWGSVHPKASTYRGKHSTEKRRHLTTPRAGFQGMLSSDLATQ